MQQSLLEGERQASAPRSPLGVGKHLLLPRRHAQEALAERDRAARMAALHMRGLYQRLEALEGLAKGLPPQPPPQQQQVPSSAWGGLASCLQLCATWPVGSNLSH